MSNACYEWYQRNVYSKQSFTNMINKILYIYIEWINYNLMFEFKV
jgi:hypothetical protein